jgi:hypothetical protein
VEAIRLIQEHTAPADFVVTDQQMQAFRAERRIPPSLCDTSTVRIQSGYLHTADAIQAAKDARMILLWTHRLDTLPGFADWVHAHYRVLREFDGKTIFLKDQER